jgi:hypothetical protein
MYNISHSGALSAIEFKELLRSLEVDVNDQPALSAIYAEVCAGLQLHGDAFDAQG